VGPQFPEYGVDDMKRRDFLRLSLLSVLAGIFGKKVMAAKKPEQKLKEAMFWRKLDEE
jgi:hypothetical protein